MTGQRLIPLVFESSLALLQQHIRQLCPAYCPGDAIGAQRHVMVAIAPKQAPPGDVDAEIVGMRACI
jgi:hypothetical protein